MQTFSLVVCGGTLWIYFKTIQRKILHSLSVILFYLTQFEAWAINIYL